ncbi:uncharacterized protein CIMG_07895 [Coccidioides immitis RS]|uniref:Uncharacterized protein n=4 Tax=Coccidioides immitis TaxID=5501 RepID=J3K4C6_COCIM|nr:uncharacterized protein CIMG_07895 [Coccidioides immitis RS]KMP06268.1 hypothetical protein CIRG_05950 [Coccidioides immitis RMSCC 2394]KMU80527.1 hypothetical protein CISG_02378 [Coccidioides immitis RMSCC 3703]KMU91316.1 hypothetical protein CIHG_09193 [Coccidioides immitis H538.4]TPX22724.1 hypothetical protein DIZ76_014603 [Coccidioides immitis]EAS29149.3 hypothetical protein CIMG_07895 [Coccidioides immitis RS]
MPDATPEFYTVWKIQERLTIPDPEETKTRYHTYLFIQKNDTSNNGSNDTPTPPGDVSGWTHEVTGDIATSTGMIYIHKSVTASPEYSGAFYAKHLLGRVRADAYPGNVDGVCRSIKPPGCQKKFNMVTMRYEGVVSDDDGEGGRKWRFYEPGEERKGYFKCTEWVERNVVPKLQRDGILVD